MRLAFTVLAFLGLATSQAAAQTAGDAAQPQQEVPPEFVKFQEFVQSKEYIQRVGTVALNGDKDIDPSCADPKAKGRAALFMFRPPTFKDGVAYPVAGAWKDQIRVDRCGKTVLHNVLVLARENGPPGMGLLLPGTTGALPPLQTRSLPLAVKYAMDKAKCTDSNKVIVADTRQDKALVQPKPDAEGRLAEGKWQEVWTVKACGKTVEVPVVFSADGKGGINVTTGEPAKKTEKKSDKKK